MLTLREKMKQNMTLKGLTLGTQEQYLRAIVKLHDHYHRSPAKLSDEEIKAFLLTQLSNNIYEPSSYNVMIHGLKFFYESVLHRKSVDIFLPRIINSQKLPDILSQEEVTQIIKATRNLMYRTIFILVYGAGLRTSEITNLEIKDLDSQRNVIHIRNAKGHKDRYVILSPTMLHALRVYWKTCRNTKNATASDLIFVNRKGQKLSVSAISIVYQNSKHLACIQKRGRTHALRHAFATHALESGVSIYAIKQLLGHSSMTSTLRYLRMTNDHLKEIPSPIEQLNLK